MVSGIWMGSDRWAAWPGLLGVESHAHHHMWRGRTQSGDSEKAQSCRKQATTMDEMRNLQETELLTTQARPNNTKHPLQPPSHYYNVCTDLVIFLLTAVGLLANE